MAGAGREIAGPVLPAEIMIMRGQRCHGRPGRQRGQRNHRATVSIVGDSEVGAVRWKQSESISDMAAVDREQVCHLVISRLSPVVELQLSKIQHIVLGKKRMLVAKTLPDNAAFSSLSVALPAKPIAPVPAAPTAATSSVPASNFVPPE